MLSSALRCNDTMSVTCYTMNVTCYTTDCRSQVGTYCSVFIDPHWLHTASPAGGAPHSHSQCAVESGGHLCAVGTLTVGTSVAMGAYSELAQCH